MQKQLILAGLMTLAGTALASTTNMENPLYKNKEGVSSLITADQDSADQYCFLKGFTASEDFEVTYKSSQSWTYDGEKWILEDTDAVLKSVECQGDRAEVEPYGRRYPKRPGRRYPGGGYPGGGYPGGGYPGGGYPGGGYPGGGYPGGGYPVAMVAILVVAIRVDIIREDTLRDVTVKSLENGTEAEREHLFLLEVAITAA